MARLQGDAIASASARLAAHATAAADALVALVAPGNPAAIRLAAARTVLELAGVGRALDQELIASEARRIARELGASEDEMTDAVREAQLLLARRRRVTR